MREVYWFIRNFFGMNFCSNNSRATQFTYRASRSLSRRKRDATSDLLVSGTVHILIKLHFIVGKTSPVGSWKASKTGGNAVEEARAGILTPCDFLGVDVPMVISLKNTILFHFIWRYIYRKRSTKGRNMKERKRERKQQRKKPGMEAFMWMFICLL